MPNCLNDQANISWFTSTRGVYWTKNRYKCTLACHLPWSCKNIRWLSCYDMKTWLDEDGNIVYQHYKASKQVISVSECVQRMVNTKGVQYLAMSTDFNAHLISRWNVIVTVRHPCFVLLYLHILYDLLVYLAGIVNIEKYRYFTETNSNLVCISSGPP